MTFDEFTKKCWAEHAEDSSGVANRLGDGFGLIEKIEQLAQFAHLSTHVFGEHLGEWQRGIEFLDQLKAISKKQFDLEIEPGILRSIAILKYCLIENAEGKEENFYVGLVPSEQIRVLASAAGALTAQKQMGRGIAAFHKAVDAAAGLAKDDPANRALAVGANNLACTLEELSPRSAEETKLMVMAAQVARKYWEIAGTWKEVFWAEYRLSRSFLKADFSSEAVMHSEKCLSIANAKGAGAVEFFYAFEALALSLKADGQSCQSAIENAMAQFQLLDEADKEWCNESLKSLEKV